MGINTGAFLGPIVCGYLAESPDWGWHYGFAAAGVGMVLGLITYVWGRERYLPGIGMPPAEATAKTSIAAGIPASNPMHAIGGAAVGGVIGFLGGGWLGLAMGAVIGAALAIAILGSHGDERRRVFAIFIVAFFVVFFWAAYEQAGSSMNLFADRNTDLTLGGLVSKPIPASWFQSVKSRLHPDFLAGVRVDLDVARQTRHGAVDGDENGDRTVSARHRISVHGRRREGRRSWAIA